MTDFSFLHYFLGLQVLQTNEGIFLSQSKYSCDLLCRFHMDDCKPTPSPFQSGVNISATCTSPEVDATLYRQLVGSLFTPGTSTPTRTFFFSGPKSYNALQIPYRNLLSPTGYSIDLPAVFSGNRVSRYRETCEHGSRATQNPETRWVRTSTLSVPVGDFPIGKSEHTMSCFTASLNLRTPNSDAHVQYPLATSPPLSLLYRESRDRDFTGCDLFALGNPECRIPILRIANTCPARDPRS
jgi:hypothetical protein